VIDLCKRALAIGAKRDAALPTLRRRSRAAAARLARERVSQSSARPVGPVGRHPAARSGNPFAEPRHSSAAGSREGRSARYLSAANHCRTTPVPEPWSQTVADYRRSLADSRNLAACLDRSWRRQAHRNSVNLGSCWRRTTRDPIPNRRIHSTSEDCYRPRKARTRPSSNVCGSMSLIHRSCCQPPSSRPRGGRSECRRLRHRSRRHQIPGPTAMTRSRLHRRVRVTLTTGLTPTETGTRGRRLMRLSAAVGRAPSNSPPLRAR
jgi:hypothetical protein